MAIFHSGCGRIVFLYLRLLGLTTIQYDVAARRITRSKLLQYFSYAQHCLLLLLMPQALQLALTRIPLYDTNPLSWYTNVINTALQIVLLLLTMALQRQRDEQLIVVLQQLWRLHGDYFARFHGIITHDKGTKLQRLLDFIIGIMWYHMLIAMAGGLTLIWQAGWHSIGFLYYLCILVSTPYAILLQHAFILVGVRDAFMLLAAHIANIFEMANRDPSAAEAKCGQELRDACHIHIELIRCTRRLNEIHQCQLMYVLANFCITSASTGYYCFIVAMGKPLAEFNAPIYMLGVSLYLLVCIKMGIYNFICDVTVQAAVNVQFNVARFVELEPTIVSTDLQQMCDIHNLRLTQSRQFSINLFGIFDINQRTTFNMAAQIILLAIVLVQTDYKNI